MYRRKTNPVLTSKPVKPLSASALRQRKRRALLKELGVSKLSDAPEYMKARKENTKLNRLKNNYEAVLRYRERQQFDATATKLCKVCKEASFEGRIALGAKKNKHSIMAADVKVMCSHCGSTIIQGLRKQSNTETLQRELLNLRSHDDLYDHSNPSCIVNDMEFSLSDMLRELLPEMPTLPEESIRIKVIKLTKEDNSSMVDSEVISGVLGEVEPYQESIQHRVLSLDNIDTTFDGLLVVFPDNNNFVYLAQTPTNTDDVERFGALQNEHVVKGTKHSRSGPAGGFVFPTTDSMSLTKCTTNQKPLLVPNPESSGLSVHYDTEDGVKGYGGVYNQVKGLAFKKGHRAFGDDKSHIWCQSSMMKSRLIASMVTQKLGLDSAGTCLNGLKKIIAAQHVFDFWAAMYSWSSTFKRCFIYQALTCHKDTSPVMESMMYFPRVQNAKGSVVTMSHGYLFIPKLAIVFKMLTGYQSMHCKLNQYFHAPDASRNYKNLTAVNHE